MTILDLESCLAPLSEDNPTGEDLEYDLEFGALEMAAQGTPDRVDRVKDPEDSSREIDRVIPGKEPNYPAVMESALALFKRTRDLRVAMQIVAAATRLHGLPGLAASTALIAGLLERYWDEVHPRLLADDDFDPTMRINILSIFSDTDGVLRVVKLAPLVESRAIGRFVVRDLEVVTGELAPMAGQAVPTKELLAVTCGQTEPDELAKRAEACQAALLNLKTIYSLFNDKTNAVPDFAPLRKVLDRAAKFYAENTASESAVPEDGAAADGFEDAGGAVASRGPAPAGVPGAGRLASREDAKVMLEKVCDYLERTEPAHPSPILVRRAIRLLDMNFLDIMRELTPDAVREIEHLGGLNRD